VRIAVVFEIVREKAAKEEKERAFFHPIAE